MKFFPRKNKEDRAPQADEGSFALGPARSDVTRLVDEFFSNPWSLVGGSLFPLASGWSPSVEVVDGENELILRAEIPGVDPKEVEVTVSGNVLTFSGEKKESREVKGEKVYRSECRYGSFSRSVELPNGVDAREISAEHGKGVLTIRIAKSKAPAAKRIPVSTK